MTRVFPFLAVLLAPTLALAEGGARERRLHADTVTSSSFLWNDWNRFQENYLPLYVSDGDPRTAWTEGAESAGEGEWIRMQVTPMEGASRVRLRIRDGYFKSPGLFKANARAKEVTIKLLPSEKTTKVTLADLMEWQEAVAEQPEGKLEAIEIKADSVYPGSKYSDLCISDIEIYVTATTKENPAFEKSKLAKVLAWKGERLDAAKLFKEGASKDLPLLPSYKLAQSEGGKDLDLWEACREQGPVCWTKKTMEAAVDIKAKHEEAFKLAAAILDEQGSVPAKMVPVDKRPLPSVDGIYVPHPYQAVEPDYGYNGAELPIPGTLASLQSDKLGVLTLEGKDIKTTLDNALAARAPSCHSKRGQTYTWALRDKSAEGRDRVRALLFVRCSRVEMRDGYDDAALLQVAVYDADSKLELTIGPGYVNSWTWVKKDAVALISGGQSIYADGRKAELTGPEIAQNP